MALQQRFAAGKVPEGREQQVNSWNNLDAGEELDGDSDKVYDMILGLTNGEATM